jgi:chitinase
MKWSIIFGVVLLGTFLSIGGVSAKHAFGAYFESWAETWSNPSLPAIPCWVSYLYLSFAMPGMSYAAGSMDLTGTGLQFPYNGPTLASHIQQLKANNTAIKVILSVGGSGYTDWSSTNYTAIGNLVQDFDLDGVDIDYEVQPTCGTTGGVFSCSTDTTYTSIITTMRSTIGSSKLLTAAMFSTGAYGTGAWANAQPSGSAYAGMAINPLKNAGSDLDVVNVMSYDAGTSYDPVQAYQAYKYYYPSGIILMGVEVPPEAWGGHVYTVQNTQQLAGNITGANDGMMIWAVQKVPTGTVNDTNPDANLLGNTICNSLELSTCSGALWSGATTASQYGAVGTCPVNNESGGSTTGSDGVIGGDGSGGDGAGSRLDWMLKFLF